MSPRDIPADVRAALVAAYDRDHLSLTDDPALRDALATAAWEWLAAGSNPIVSVDCEDDDVAAE
jgi:hypothetical protein